MIFKNSSIRLVNWTTLVVFLIISSIFGLIGLLFFDTTTSLLFFGMTSLVFIISGFHTFLNSRILTESTHIDIHFDYIESHFIFLKKSFAFNSITKVKLSDEFRAWGFKLSLPTIVFMKFNKKEFSMAWPSNTFDQKLLCEIIKRMSKKIEIDAEIRSIATKKMDFLINHLSKVLLALHFLVGFAFVLFFMWFGAGYGQNIFLQNIGENIFVLPNGFVMGLLLFISISGFISGFLVLDFFLTKIFPKTQEKINKIWDFYGFTGNNRVQKEMQLIGFFGILVYSVLFIFSLTSTVQFSENGVILSTLTSQEKFEWNDVKEVFLECDGKYKDLIITFNNDIKLNIFSSEEVLLSLNLSKEKTNEILKLANINQLKTNCAQNQQNLD